MPDFAYTALDADGRQVSGQLAAGTEREALALLDEKSLFPVEVKAHAPQAALWQGRRIKGQLMAAAYGQLSDLLRSGVPLLKGLEVLRKQTSHPELQKVLESLHAHVQEGGTLADGMARHPRAFGAMAVNMVRAGGEGGFLEESLDRVAEFTEKQEDIKSRTIGAVAYPVFLATVGTIVVTGLVIFVVPKFEGLFDRLRRDNQLPAPTEWLLATSAFLQGWWWALAGVLVVAFLLARMKLATDAGRAWRDRTVLRLPVWGPIARQLAVARFCRVLGTMLRNGVPILRALDISSDGAGNVVLAGAIRTAAENISAGQSLARPLAASQQFPAAVVEMIAVAEESNTLDRVLVEAADSLERRTWRRLDLAVRLLEPVLLLLLAVAVLMLAIALLLPVMKMATTI
jgi:general secretion pathway protein F/type IV pilus assembly protein PilC